MACHHFDHLKPVRRSSQGCEECEKMGDTWVHLRECLLCGHVGCCDSWGWCYVDELMVQLP